MAITDVDVFARVADDDVTNLTTEQDTAIGPNAISGRRFMRRIRCLRPHPAH